jgi:hypothetical protein
MKYPSYWKLTVAALALIGAQSSGAAVYAGFYDFIGDKMTNPPPNNPANEVAPGFTAWAESPVMSAQGGGGDMDGFYGNSGIPVGAVPPAWGDGHAVIRMFATANANTTPDGSSILKFSLTNNTGYSVDLTHLYFDAAATTGQLNRSVQVDFVNAFGTTTLTTIGSLPSTNPQNFGDYGVSLGSYVMANSETVSFVFTIPNGGTNPAGTVVWIDNVAIVPEPGSLMAFGCMVMTGLMFRKRRS